MEINWFTVIAQILNFLVLVWLLKRFLYKPILDAIDAREERITARIADAELKDADADKKVEEYNRKNMEFDAERNDLIKEAKKDAKAEGDKLVEEAQISSVEMRKKMESSILSQYAELENDIAQKTKEEVFAIARKTLKDLADTSLEDQIVLAFTNKLKQLDGDEKAELLTAFDNSNDQKIVVWSTYDLSEKQKANIGDVIKQLIDKNISFEYKTNQALISGIEIATNGYKVAWSIAEYLDLVAKKIEELVKTGTKSEQHVNV